MNPRNQQRTNGVKLMRGDLPVRPLVILDSADGELDFVRSFQVLKILPTITFDLAAAWTFQIHDAPHARVNLRNVSRAAGFKQDGKTVIAKLFHQRQRIRLKQRFAAGQFDQW